MIPCFLAAVTGSNLSDSKIQALLFCPVKADRKAMPNNAIQPAFRRAGWLSVVESVPEVVSTSCGSSYCGFPLTAVFLFRNIRALPLEPAPLTETLAAAV